MADELFVSHLEPFQLYDMLALPDPHIRAAFMFTFSRFERNLHDVLSRADPERQLWHPAWTPEANWEALLPLPRHAEGLDRIFREGCRVRNSLLAGSFRPGDIADWAELFGSWEHLVNAFGYLQPVREVLPELRTSLPEPLAPQLTSVKVVQLRCCRTLETVEEQPGGWRRTTRREIPSSLLMESLFDDLTLEDTLKRFLQRVAAEPQWLAQLGLADNAGPIHT